jgi:hypothetical protein
MSEMIHVQPGDWVRLPQVFPGIWRVYRVLTGIKMFEWDPDRPIYKTNSTLVFCHRLVNDAWKRSFSHQSCDLSLVNSLASNEIERVEALLLSDNRLNKAFEQYQGQQRRIDMAANISFGGLSADGVKSFPAQCNAMLAGRINNGITLPEVMVLLKANGLDKHLHEIPQLVTLQLGCINHELRGSEFLFREYKTLYF